MVTTFDNLSASDAASLPLERVEAELFELAGHLAAGEARFLALLAEFDRREGWRGWGAMHCVQWLGWRLGIGPHTAREKLRVARALEHLPRIASAFSKGQLSFTQVRAITRVAGLHNEQALIDTAKGLSGQQLEAVVAGIVNADKAADPDFARRQLENRGFDRRHGALNLSILRFWLTPDDDRRVRAALERVADHLKAERGDHAPATRGQLLADALVAMADNVLAGAELRQADGDRTFHCVVHADEDILEPIRCHSDDNVLEPIPQPVDAQAEGADRTECVGLDPKHSDAPRAHIDAGLAVTAETIRRIMCDVSASRLVERSDGGYTIEQHQQSTLPRWARRAIRLRDNHCRFPGCTSGRIDIHHVRWRSRRGDHALANLAGLCRYHHRLVHEGGWSIRVEADGTLRFFDPVGRELPLSPPERTGSIVRLITSHTASIEATTVPTRLDDGYDWRYIVDVLCVGNYPNHFPEYFN